MCGICGIVFRDRERTVDERTLIRMRDTMIPRGPDDAGIAIEGQWGLGHRRLSILDLSSRAKQPMTSASGRYCLTYNGEIYNFQQLRDELRGRGHDFRSEGDTEVLVEALDEWGLDETLRRIDGIFAFAAWDGRKRQLLAARDQFGIKPFYYAQRPEAFSFASSVKALWAAGLEREVDPEALEELLVFRYVAGEPTPFRGVTELLPGHCLELAEGVLRLRPYWRAADHLAGERERPERWVERFRRAVRAQRVSDVPLGTFLSGGLDSSTLTAELASSQPEPLDTFTASVPSSEGTDEWPYAEALAQRWSCRAHRVRIPADRVLDRLREAQRQHDEPLAHGNDLYLYELSRLAKRHVTVLLSGEGADETLGGYVRYQSVRWPRLWRLAASGTAAPLRAVLAARRERSLRTLHRMLTMESLEDVQLYNAVDLLPRDLERIGFEARGRFAARRSLLEEASRATQEPLKQLMLYDLQTFLCSLLNRNDRMTMGASIECRVPFLSVGVVESALRLPITELFAGRQGKCVLRRCARELVPASILQRPKWGLGIPWNRYLRQDPACRAFVEALPQSGLGRALQATCLPAALDEFLSGDDGWAPVVYQVFSLAVWWEQIVECPLELEKEQAVPAAVAERVS
jgi:asparagine synthase (glutamine-hydrolysing)